MTAPLYDDEGRILGPFGALAGDQEVAVGTRSGSLLVSANAGAGKTTVLTERYVRYIVEDGLSPHQILAVTFTDKAAGELRLRIRTRLGQFGREREVHELDRAPIGTFHSLCARILRADALRAGVDPGFAISDESQSRAIADVAWEQALAAVLGDAGDELIDVAAAYGADGLRKIVLEAYGRLRSRGEREPALPAGVTTARNPDPGPLLIAIAEALDALVGHSGKTVDKARDGLLTCRDLLETGDPPGPAQVAATICKPGGTRLLLEGAPARARELQSRYVQDLWETLAGPSLGLIDALLRAYGEAYRAAKLAHGVLDFEDLELGARDLLSAEPAIAARYRRRHLAVLVDEFQDTNPVQMQLLELVAGDRFVVGDALQSIYGFRHADVDIFRGERTRLTGDGSVAEIAENYRTRPEILTVVDAALGPLHGADHVAFRAVREPAGDAPLVELLLTDIPDAPAGELRAAEAESIAGRIAELVAAGTAPGSIAVLLRALTDVAIYQDALERAGIPALASVGGFWSRQETLDLRAYLNVLANPRDELSLFGVLASPLAGLSSDALTLLARAAAQGERWRLLERRFGGAGHDAGAADEGLVLPAADEERLRDLMPWLAAERVAIVDHGLAALIDRAVERSGYDLHVLALPGGRGRFANVQKLIAFAADFERRNGRDLRGLVDTLAAEAEAATRETDASIEQDGSAVSLMTIHAAKGLEFDVVCVADLGRGANRALPDLLVDEDRVGLVVRTRAGGSAKTAAYGELAEVMTRAAAEEERRVFHVAVTRPRERLILSGPALPPRNSAGAWLVPAFVPDLAQLLEAEPDGDLDCVRVHPGAPQSPGVRVVVVRGGAREEAGPGATGDGVPDGAGAADRALPGTEATALPPAGPAAVSYSALMQFERCPYRYHLQSRVGLPDNRFDRLVTRWQADGGPVRISPAERGTLVHELLAEIDPARPSLPDAGHVHDVARRLRLDPSGPEIEDARTLTGHALASAVVARAFACRDVRREHQFAFTLADDRAMPLLHGVIDLLARDGDRAIVVDYKTDAVAGDTDLEDLTELHYGVQRRIYGLAALSAGVAEVEVAHLYLARPDEPAVAVYGTGDTERLRAEMATRVAPIASGFAAPTSEPRASICQGCPARGGLCPHPDELTSR